MMAKLCLKNLNLSNVYISWFAFCLRYLCFHFQTQLKSDLRLKSKTIFKLNHCIVVLEAAKHEKTNVKMKTKIDSTSFKVQHICQLEATSANWWFMLTLQHLPHVPWPPLLWLHKTPRAVDIQQQCHLQSHMGTVHGVEYFQFVRCCAKQTLGDFPSQSPWEVSHFTKAVKPKAIIEPMGK